MAFIEKCLAVVASSEVIFVHTSCQSAIATSAMKCDVQTNGMVRPPGNWCSYKVHVFVVYVSARGNGIQSASQVNLMCQDRSTSRVDLLNTGCRKQLGALGAAI